MSVHVFDNQEPYHGGYALVWQGERCGFIDTQGTVIVPVMYLGAHTDAISDGFMVRTDKGWGVVNNHNKALISFDWTTIQRTTKADGDWDGYRCYSELKPGKYFRYTTTGIYQGNMPIPKAQPQASEPLPTASTSGDKATHLTWGDTTYTIVEKRGQFRLFADGEPLNWPTNWHDFVNYLQVNALTTND